MLLNAFYIEKTLDLSWFYISWSFLGLVVVSERARCEKTLKNVHGKIFGRLNFFFFSFMRKYFFQQHRFLLRYEENYFIKFLHFFITWNYVENFLTKWDDNRDDGQEYMSANNS